MVKRNDLALDQGHAEPVQMVLQCPFPMLPILPGSRHLALRRRPSAAWLWPAPALLAASLGRGSCKSGRLLSIGGWGVDPGPGNAAAVDCIKGRREARASHGGAPRARPYPEQRKVPGSRPMYQRPSPTSVVPHSMQN